MRYISDAELKELTYTIKNNIITINGKGFRIFKGNPNGIWVIEKGGEEIGI